MICQTRTLILRSHKRVRIIRFHTNTLSRIGLFMFQGPDNSCSLLPNGVIISFNLVDFHTWIFWQVIRPLQWSYQTLAMVTPTRQSNILCLLLHKVKVTIQKRTTPKRSSSSIFEFYFLRERCVQIICQGMKYYPDTRTQHN